MTLYVRPATLRRQRHEQAPARRGSRMDRADHLVLGTFGMDRARCDVVVPVGVDQPLDPLPHPCLVARANRVRMQSIVPSSSRVWMISSVIRPE